MRYLLLIIMSLLMGAANADWFTPVANDQSMLLINSLFPGLTGAGGADSVVGAMGIFNGAVLMMGGVLATYTLLAGTLGTAHDGEMLGKKFSSVWIPIRYALGTAAVLPTIGGGYNIMQWCVMWLVMQSVGMADAVWTKYVDSQNITNIAATSIQAPNAKQLAYTTLNIEVCMAAVAERQASKAAGTGDAVIYGDISAAMTKEDGLTTKTYYFGDKNETTGLKKNSCGSVNFAKFTMPVQTANGFTNFMTGFTNAQKIIDAQEAQFAALAASLTPIAAKIYSTGKAGDVAAITAATNNYQANVAKAAAGMITNSDAFSDLSKNASQDGWATAGFWFVKLANLQDLTQRSLAAIPTATGPSPDDTGTLEAYAGVFPAVMETFQKGGANITGVGMGNEPGGSNTGWWATIKSAVINIDPTVIIKKAFTTGMNLVIQDGEHPLMAIKRIGNTTLTIAADGFLGCLAALATVGNAPGIGMAIVSAMFMFVVPLAIIGVTLSYVIPFMPALIWLGILAGWIIQVFTAILAASIWAVMHLHPNGDDLTGKGGNGYNLVMGLLFRPVLSVFGLIATLSVMQVFGQFVNKIFADNFLVSQQDSNLFIWMIGIIAASLMYCVAQLTTIKKLLEIMHIVPDSLMEWIGGGASTLGEYAKSLGHGGDHSTQVAAGMNLMQQAGNGAMNSMNEMKRNGMGAESKLTDAAMQKQGMGAGQKDIKNMLQSTLGDKTGMFGMGGREMSQSQVAMKSTHDGIKSNLSSANPEMAAQYEKNLDAMSTNPAFSNDSPTDLMNRAMETTLRQNYGQGARTALQTVSGGSMSGQEFQSALNSYETAKQAAMADNPTGYKKDLMAASSAINTELKGNASKPAADQVAPGEIINKHLASFNEGDAVVQPAQAIASPVAAPAVQETEVAAPVAETPAVEPVSHTPEPVADGQWSEPAAPGTSDTQIKE